MKRNLKQVTATHGCLYHDSGHANARPPGGPEACRGLHHAACLEWKACTNVPRPPEIPNESSKLGPKLRLCHRLAERPERSVVQLQKSRSWTTAPALPRLLQACLPHLESTCLSGEPALIQLMQHLRSCSWKEVIRLQDPPSCTHHPDGGRCYCLKFKLKKS